MKKQKISDAVIHRLPRYYRYLDDLYNKGVVRISSNSLGAKMDITASQIRQDLSCFGEFGQQGYGYNVAELRAEIGHILGIDSGHRIIVIGVGHLGHALLQNFDFDKVGFRIDSAFDVSPALIGTEIRGVSVHSMDELEEYVANYHPNVAVLEFYQCGALHQGGRRFLRGHPLCGHPADAQLSHLAALRRTLYRSRHTMRMRPMWRSNFHRRLRYV